MKYDVADLASDNPGKGWEIRKMAGWDQGQVVILGGSTHPGEEKALADRVQALKPKHPRLRLMLVPRHVERKGEILQQLSATGLKTGLRSRLEMERGSDPDILLVDSTGELRDLYPACELVFIGKTLTGKGGQNFLEAARYGRAILAGPHMDNFQSLRREFQADKAMVVCADPAALQADLDRLLASANEREELGRRAQACFREHLGAGARHVEALLEFLQGRV
jgi:3-deoxy-D-manno-octulosonic-acid transferase